MFIITIIINYNIVVQSLCVRVLSNKNVQNSMSLNESGFSLFIKQFYKTSWYLNLKFSELNFNP